MTFKLSGKDQNIFIYHFDKKGIYIGKKETLIEANTGLPAESTNISPPEFVDNADNRLNGKMVHKFEPILDHWIEIYDPLKYEKEQEEAIKFNTEKIKSKPLGNVDIKNIRKNEYSSRYSHLLQEAEIKKHLGLTDEYNALMGKVILEREKIQKENPLLDELS